MSTEGEQGQEDTTTATITDDAAFNAGFDTPTEPTETPAQDETTTPEPEEAPAPKIRQITEDEYSAIQQQIADAVGMKATLEKVSGTAFGKIGGIERSIKSLTDAPGPGIAQEHIDALREDGFEPLADALEHLNKLRVIPAAVDQEQISTMVQARLDEVVPAIEQKIEARFLSREHPDWQEVDKSPEWAAHLAALPAERQQALADASARWDSAVIASEMSAFKKARAAAPQLTQAGDLADARRNRLKAAAATPRGSGGDTGTNPQDDFDAGFQSG